MPMPDWICCYYCCRDNVILIPVLIRARDHDTGLNTGDYEQQKVCLRCLKEQE